MTPIAALFATPSSFAGDPYGGLTNQFGHYALGVGLFLLVVTGWHWARGEMPRRWPVAWGLVAVYAGGIELAWQGWHGLDTVEDVLFFAMGPVTVAGVVREVKAEWPDSYIVLNAPRLFVFIAWAVMVLAVYTVGRL